MTAIDGTIPDSQITGVQQYEMQDPTAAGSPGVIVPPAVLQMLMKTSTALAPKPSAIPPHPQISQLLTPLPLGFQMAFNQLTSPTPYGNVISSYRIYRNKTANAFSGAQLIRTIAHDPTHQGAVTVQDSTGANATYYYFITAVDTTGQESAPGQFQFSAVTSSTTGGTPIQTFSRRPLGSTVSVSANTDTLIDAITINAAGGAAPAFPLTGGPFRVLVSYVYYCNGGVGWSASVNDGSNDFAGMQGEALNNNMCLSMCEYSPVTYTGLSAVTFQTRCYGDGSGSIVTTPSGEGSPAKLWNRGTAHMQVSLFPSN